MIERPNKEEFVKFLKINCEALVEEDLTYPFYYNDELDGEGIPELFYEYLHEQIENSIICGAYEVNIKNIQETEND